MSSLNPADAGPEWLRFAAILRAARERLHNLRIDEPAIPACVAGLARIEAMLRRPLRTAVLGEYNSGKTSVTGLVIGKGLLPVSVLSNTGVPVLVGYGSEPALFGIDENGISIRIDGAGDDALTDLDYRAVDIRLPLPWLQHHQVLDTPATMTPALFTSDCDIAIWCTVATRAWTESERTLWSTIPARCFRSALLVATHKDSFYSDDECSQVLRRLQAMTNGLFRDALLVSAAPEESDEDGARVSGETAILRAAIEGSAQIIRNRRLKRARRIVQRLARLALHEFGRNAISPASASALANWQTVSDRALQEHRAGRMTLDRTARSLVHTFAYTAEELKPGVIRAPDRNDTRPPVTPAAIGSPSPARHAAMMRADLTAVLRILASETRFEPPEAREQRNAARATLMSLADLDGIFAGLGQWLATAATTSELRRPQLNA